MNSLQQVVIWAATDPEETTSFVKSDRPPILYPLGGRPVVHYVLDLAHQMVSEPPHEVILVVNPALEHVVIQTPFFSHKTIVQPKEAGTEMLSSCLKNSLKPTGHVLFLSGNTPLIQKSTLDRLICRQQQQQQQQNNESKTGDDAIVVVGMKPHDPQNYARLIMNEWGELEKVVPQKYLTEAQKSIPLCYSGIMLLRGDILASLLLLLSAPAHSSNPEFDVANLVEMARHKGYSCRVVENGGDAREFRTISTRQDLAGAEGLLQNQWREQAMTNGVTLLDPQQVYFSYDTKLASDITIHPYVTLGPRVTIDQGTEILSFCRISETVIGKNTLIGPFAHLRNGVLLQDSAEIGNFVECKQSTIGSHTKAKHLSYLGDADIGPRTNIGAGTITCNYNGFTKSQTRIGEGVFIGSNSCLIAPLAIGDYALVGAGSVITKNVSSHDLALARATQTTIDKGADAFREKQQKRKDAL